MKKLITFLFIACLSLAVYAGDRDRKGTTGADQLLIPVGARGIATGGAFIANLTGLESIYYNPAGLDVTAQTEAMFSYLNYIADINMSYFAAATSLGDVGSIGLSIKTMSFGDIPITTADFPDGTGSTYSPSFIVLGLTYSKVITDRISVGTNIKLINETIVNTSATGFGIDVGVQYRFDNRLSLGVALKNIGPNMKYSGPDLQTSTSIPGSFIGTGGGTFEITAEEFQIPSYFELSVAYAYPFNEQNSLVIASTYTANNSLEDLFLFGLEYSYLNTFFIRGGYDMLVENADESIYGFTAGAGISYQIGDQIGIGFDYAFREVKDFPSSNHIITVKLMF